MTRTLTPKNRVRDLIPSPNGNGHAAAEKSAKQVKAARKQVLGILPLVRRRLSVIVDGNSPLLVHQFDEKSQRQMEAPQTGAAKAPREKRVFVDEYARSLYWLSKMPKKPTEANIARGRFGFPCAAFGKAMVASAPYVGGGVDKQTVKAAVRVLGDLTEIHGKPRMHKAVVRLSDGTPMTRYRGIFDSWWAKLDIEFSESILSAEQVVNLLHSAGFYIGVGEHRPERNGSNGMFGVRAGKAPKS